jgi:hypothetical protein
MFATDAVTGCLPVQIAAKLLGHPSLAITQAYLGIVNDELVYAYRAFLGNHRDRRPRGRRVPGTHTHRVAGIPAALRTAQGRARLLQPPPTGRHATTSTLAYPN